MGKLIIICGLILVAIGLLYIYFPQAINWFGKLPGDIRVEKPNARFYFPIVSMLVVSVILNIIFRLYKYFQ